MASITFEQGVEAPNMCMQVSETADLFSAPRWIRRRTRPGESAAERLAAWPRLDPALPGLCLILAELPSRH